MIAAIWQIFKTATPDKRQIWETDIGWFRPSSSDGAAARRTYC